MQKRYEFRVSLEGIELNSEQEEKLCQVVHQAAITELAASDFQGDFASLVLRGRLGGRSLVALSQEQLQRAGLEPD